jgi:hypothetical protein
MNYVGAEEKWLFCRKPASNLVFRIILAWDRGGIWDVFYILGEDKGFRFPRGGPT